ncbi:hypothetical protein H6B28_17070 [Bacteroides mediterraneensis]|nr:hypothetical protein [Bacteroides mediterraneensis]
MKCAALHHRVSQAAAAGTHVRSARRTVEGKVVKAGALAPSRNRTRTGHVCPSCGGECLTGSLRPA